MPFTGRILAGRPNRQRIAEQGYVGRNRAVQIRSLSATSELREIDREITVRRGYGELSRPLSVEIDQHPGPHKRPRLRRQVEIEISGGGLWPKP